MKKIWLMLTISLLAYGLMDVYIWQRIFEASSRYHGVWVDEIFHYRVAWQVILLGFALVGTIAAWPEKRKMLFFPAALFALAHSGLEDIFYYFLDGRMVPESLPWLNESWLVLAFGEVSRLELFFSAALWLMFFILLSMCLEKHKKPRV